MWSDKKNIHYHSSTIYGRRMNTWLPIRSFSLLGSIHQRENSKRKKKHGQQQQHKTQFPARKKRYINRMFLKKWPNEKKEEEKSRTMDAPRRWQFKSGDVEYFIATQHLLFRTFEARSRRRTTRAAIRTKSEWKNDKITLHSYSICICTQSATKSNWLCRARARVCVFFVSVSLSLSCRCSYRWANGKKLANLTWKKTIRWLNTCSRIFELD